MAKRPRFVLGVLIAGLLVILGVWIVADRINLPWTIFNPSLNQKQEEAGRAQSYETFLKGGPLQRGLQGKKAEIYLLEETETEIPQYTTPEFNVRPGEIVNLTLNNLSKANHQHGWVLLRPGTEQKFQMAAEQAGPSHQWIPDSPDVLAFAPLTGPGESSSVLFRAPEETGDYPFLCPFPGHGNQMHGTLHVKE